MENARMDKLKKRKGFGSPRNEAVVMVWR